MPVRGAPQVAARTLPPACLSGPGPLCPGSSLWPSPTVSPAASVAAIALCDAAGGGGGAGVRRRWGRRPGPAVSGQWSAGQTDFIAARVRAPRAAGACPPGRVPAGVAAAFVPSRIGRYACPPHVLLRGRRAGGVLRVGRPGAARGGRPALGVPGVEPSPSGSAVTCASVCVGAGAAGVAGSSSGSPSGRGRCAGPRAARC